MRWLALLPAVGLLFLPGAPLRDEKITFVVGIVQDAAGPVSEARVRFKGQANSTLTDDLGRFRLRAFPKSNRITASKAGYLIAGEPATSIPLIITLERLPSEDCELYAWVDPTADPKGKHNCANCHAETFREWSLSGHARSVSNRRFLNLFDGTDWNGGKAGWNFSADHPDGTGVCSSCHAPTLETGDPGFFDPRQIKGVATQGVHCDFCHKVADVNAGKHGWTHGRFGLKLLRPAKDQLFFGPLDDVDRGEDSFSPLYKDSKYCASCHEGVVFGVHVYSTYSEWLASPARKQGKQCQDCHMKPTGKMTNVAPGRGGVARDPATLSNHRMFNGSQEAMLRNCLVVKSSLAVDKGSIRATVTIRAENVGHQVPTGFVDRNLVLVVEGLDGNGRSVEASAGPRLPALAGRTLAGKAGRLFAKQLTDFDGKTPAPFWSARTDNGDTRLKPEETIEAVFDFPPSVEKVCIRVLYRRFWPEVAEAKGWPDDGVVVHEQMSALPRKN